VLFSRDLQSGAIVLYLARPLSVTAFAMTRWLSLFVAILIFVTLPVLTLYIGALSAEGDVSDHTSDFLVAWVGVVLLSALLATLAGLVSAYTTRRALAVGATIVTLLVSLGVATSVQAIATEAGNDLVAQLAGLLSPFSLVDGVTYSLLDGTSVYPAAPDNVGLGLLFLVVALALVAGGCWLLVRRYRKQASR
jgi:ABC-2 type transport system permease protein